MKGIIPVLMMSLILVSCDKKGGSGGSSASKPTTEEEKAFYSLGAMLGNRFKDLDLTDKELELIQSGLVDTARGKQALDPTQYQFKIQEIFNGRMKKKVEKVKEKGKAYLENFVAKEGGEKTASGLAFKVLKPGTGKTPKSTDQVEVHYHGTLIDGTVFDSSVERKKTVKFPLNRVIKGWIEGLQLVKEGGQIKLVIPSDLAYGDNGAPPKIPGGSTLIFDIELFKVVKEAPKKKGGKKRSKKKKK